MTTEHPAESLSTILLSGGGDHAAASTLANRVLLSAVAVAEGAPPRIGVLVRGVEPRMVLAELKMAIGTESRCELVELHDPLDPSSLLHLHALIVADGDAAQLLHALTPVVTDLRGMVHRGMSYWGIGAGAAIASEIALVGGTEIGGVQVAPKLSLGENGEVQLAQGLGLIDLPILPSATQLGRVGLGVALCESGMVEQVIGLDANVNLAIGDGKFVVEGDGCMWEMTRNEDGSVRVLTHQAEA